MSETHHFLYPPYPVTPSCPWTLCPFLLTRWRACCQSSTQMLQPVQTASAHVSSKPALLLFLTLSLFYSPSHLLKVICHLLGIQQTLPLCIKNVQKQIPATTDESAFSQSSERLWNLSSLQTLNPSSSPMVQKQIPATTDQSAFSQSSARLWNPSSPQTLIQRAVAERDSNEICYLHNP